ncbi:hypothetical protein MJG53_018685 [Ovis ammon polii x Ovis aries]|uniref:Uncharacterized protein n=1 Tax=Ovis ammon polii x Ovis aries TaxID=2918886 RepID=A0ACB9U432_9CETA|nr:hypothetical protein MJG53_018685 [Ovis ammon polii x Ovis aries]
MSDAVAMKLPSWPQSSFHHKQKIEQFQKKSLRGKGTCLLEVWLAWLTRALSLRQCPAILGLSEALWEPAGLLEPVLGTRQGLPRGSMISKFFRWFLFLAVVLLGETFQCSRRLEDDNTELVHNLQELRRSASLATKVFIQRDYSDGTICQFQTKFPPELDSRIERQLFEETVKTLNSFYAEAEKIGGSSYLEGCLACATAYFIFLCMETHYEKVLKKISRYIQEQNEKVFAPRGLLLTDPVERGMRVVSFLAVPFEAWLFFLVSSPLASFSPPSDCTVYILTKALGF